MANTVQEWEDFPGEESKDFVSDILGEIGIKVDEAEVTFDLDKNSHEEIKETAVIPKPQRQIQIQNEHNGSEKAYMDEYTVGSIDCMLFGIIANCLILDIAFISVVFFYLVKMCPRLKHKIGDIKRCKIQAKEEDQESASTPSTITKESISVDNVGFETE